ncbi:type II secretion system protein [Moritella sp. 24]|uniref:pilus assembly FimT family protein n=1 Tax=Moritella sp. 24 TaxID=2746230 RepID=UPI001BAC4A62|nr:type II secretion system protein [Moritella sp. 24]QUM75273.1 type II secretion system protein [Moritella sp. 24]
MKKQAGVTLVELSAVVVISSILGAMAVPRFIDLADAALDVSVVNIARGIESASALNYAASFISRSGLSTDEVVTIDNCDDAGSLLTGSSLPLGYSVTPMDIASSMAVTCTIKHIDSAKSMTFIMQGTSL